MLAMDMQPTSMVEIVESKALVMKLDSRFHIPIASTIGRRIIPEIHKTEREKLFDVLKRDKNATLAVKPYIWTSRS